MDIFNYNKVNTCLACPFMTTCSWTAELHTRLCHGELITEKTKSLLSTILETLIDPNTTKNITIIIDDKHEYLSQKHTPQQRSHSMRPVTANERPANEVLDSHFQAIKGAIASRIGMNQKTDIVLPDPSDTFRFYSQEDRDKIGSTNPRIGEQMTRFNIQVHEFIKAELALGHIINRNTIASFVAKSDMFAFSDEWFAEFSAMYDTGCD